MHTKFLSAMQPRCTVTFFTPKLRCEPKMIPNYYIYLRRVSNEESA